jgi:hypothetical protein
MLDKTNLNSDNDSGNNSDINYNATRLSTD